MCSFIYLGGICNSFKTSSVLARLGVKLIVTQIIILVTIIYSVYFIMNYD